MINLFSTQTANVTSRAFSLSSDKSDRNSQDGDRVIVPSGVFDGATVTIQISANGSNFTDLSANTITSNVAVIVYIPNELTIRAVLTNVGASTSINLDIA